MIHRDWHDRQLRFQLEVGQWLAQVRRGAELAPVSGVLYLISLFVIDKLSCDHVGKISQLPQLDTNKSGLIQVQEYQEHSSSHSSLPQQQLHVNHTCKTCHTNKRILCLLNLHPRCILPLGPGSLGTRLCRIQTQPRILHRPSRLHRKRNMTINRRTHRTIKPAGNLIILRKSRVADFFFRGRVFCESSAEMVLCAEEFGASERGTGESVGEGFGGVFGSLYECGLGFCCGRGGGEVGYFFRDGFAQVDKGFFLHGIREMFGDGGLRGLGSRRIHLRRSHCGVRGGGGCGGST